MSEINPVAEIVSAHGDPEAFGQRELVAIADIQKLPYRTKLCRHDEAMVEIERMRRENEALRKALEPFASYMKGGLDRDNLGNQLPDTDGVGWIYLTHGHFRRASEALASLGGSDNG